MHCVKNQERIIYEHDAHIKMVLKSAKICEIKQKEQINSTMKMDHQKMMITLRDNNKFKNILNNRFMAYTKYCSLTQTIGFEIKWFY